MVLTARDPAEWVPVLRRLRASGYALQVIGVGPARSVAVARARDAGIAAHVRGPGSDWRTADALALAG